MHVAAGVEVAAVHREPALHLVVLDPDHLDPEVAGEAAPMPSRKRSGVTSGLVKAPVPSRKWSVSVAAPSARPYTASSSSTPA